ncbi:MAG: hypothetical protein ABNH53_10065 [Henriciella sp.]|jgi:hypothetical protein
MSFDLLVFDPAIVECQDQKAFMDWYFQTTEWNEDHDYDDPVVATEALRDWFHDIRVEYPAMNGPYAVNDDQIDSPNVSDYSIALDAIYVGFAWSEQDGAFKTVTRFAEKHQLGVFHASSENGEIWVPDDTGKLKRVQ